MNANLNLSPASPTLHDVFVGMGSNIAPAEHLPKALRLLQEYVTVLGWSQTWETPPYGMTGGNFLNAVVHLHTGYAANTLKSLVLRRVEAILGRVRATEKFIPRTIDLDILVFDGQVIDADIWEQAHWAVPLAELFPLLQSQPEGATLQETARQLMAGVPEMKTRPGVLGRVHPATNLYGR
ncbi:MAG: 2-amino-4-hydroxy-6-hydroxymethyldihydropteridine diphosphokinase [Chloroflexota bacterium]